MSFWIFRLEWETLTVLALAESRSPPGHPQTPRQDYINLFLLHHIFKVVSIFSDDVELEQIVINVKMTQSYNYKAFNLASFG